MSEAPTTEVQPTSPSLPPPAPISDAVIAAIKAEGDQPRSSEIDLGTGITLTLGVRNLYVNADGGGVAVLPLIWR